MLAAAAAAAAAAVAAVAAVAAAVAAVAVAAAVAAATAVALAETIPDLVLPPRVTSDSFCRSCYVFPSHIHVLPFPPYLEVHPGHYAANGHGYSMLQLYVTHL